LGNYEGDDGLRIRDLPEINVEGDSVGFKQIPTPVIVRRELSKAGHQYFTFLGEEGCEYLKDYLEARIREEETLALDSSIVTPKLRMKPFIRAVNVGDTIRGAMRRAGFSWRPYVLRSYFDTQLMLAESKGLVLRDYRQFWMGHKGDIESRYTTNKCKLPEAVVEDMREAYRRSQEFLQAVHTPCRTAPLPCDTPRVRIPATPVPAGSKPSECSRDPGPLPGSPLSVRTCPRPVRTPPDRSIPQPGFPWRKQPGGVHCQASLPEPEAPVRKAAGLYEARPEPTAPKQGIFWPRRY